MSKYSTIKKEFSFLVSEYGFEIYMKQKSGAYYFLTWKNDKKKIMVLYDDRIDKRIESPLRIRIYDADSLGTFYDEVEEFKNEFFIKSGSYKERIHCAAEWLKNAIENKTVKLE